MKTPAKRARRLTWKVVNDGLAFEHREGGDERCREKKGEREMHVVDVSRSQVTKCEVEASTEG